MDLQHSIFQILVRIITVGQLQVIQHQQYTNHYQILSKCAKDLTVPQNEIFDGIQKLRQEIKELKANVDVLTLTATPIPRTLQMSLAGVRSLSLIETPPMNRYPVQTYVIEENKQIIKDAIYKEISRNGQVFILYNNIICIAVDAPQDKISALSGKIGRLEGVSSKAAYSR